MKIRIVPDKSKLPAEEWTWELLSNNGKAMCRAVHSFENKSNCIRAARTVAFSLTNSIVGVEKTK